jgi:hypothetical protein
MILFSNIYSILKVNEKSVIKLTAYQIICAAIKSKNFTTAILNSDKKLSELLNSIINQNGERLRINEVCPDKDSQIFKKFYSNCMSEIIGNKKIKDAPWIQSEFIFYKIFQFSICLILIEKCINSHSNLSEIELSDFMLDFEKNLIRAICFLDDSKIKFSDLQENLINNNYFKNKKDFDNLDCEIYTKYSSFMQMLAWDFLIQESSTDKVKLNLHYYESGNYNQTNSNLNKNNEYGDVELPSLLLKESPVDSLLYTSDAVSKYAFFDLSTLDPSMDVEKFNASLSYSLDRSCDCEHDCCGCIQTSYRAVLLNKKYAILSATKSQNI